jgi:predicted metal-dependent enzyme (double-stranded beta helix superfamily)
MSRHTEQVYYLTDLIDADIVEKLEHKDPLVASRWGVRVVTDLANDVDWMHPHVLEAEQRMPPETTQWYFARHWDNFTDRSPHLHVIVWPPKCCCLPHPHSSWGVYWCMLGRLREEQWDYLNNGKPRPTHPATAATEDPDYWRPLSPGTGPAIVQRSPWLWHRLVNPSDYPAVTINLYGPSEWPWRKAIQE